MTPPTDESARAGRGRRRAAEQERHAEAERERRAPAAGEAHRRPAAAQHLIPTCRATTPVLKVAGNVDVPEVASLSSSSPRSFCWAWVACGWYPRGIGSSSRIARHPLANARHTSKEYESQALDSGAATFENSSTSKRPAWAVARSAHRRTRGSFVGHVAQVECHADEVELLVAKGRGTALHPSDVGKARPFVEQAGLCLGPARPSLMSVCTTVPLASDLSSGQRARQVAGAASDVEHLVAFVQRLGPRPRCRPSTSTRQAHRHQVVHHVVARMLDLSRTCAAHALGLSSDRRPTAKTEVVLAHRCWCSFSRCRGRRRTWVLRKAWAFVAAALLAPGSPGPRTVCHSSGLFASRRRYK